MDVNFGRRLDVDLRGIAPTTLGRAGGWRAVHVCAVLQEEVVKLKEETQRAMEELQHRLPPQVKTPP